MITRRLKDCVGQLPVGVLLPTKDPKEPFRNVRDFEMGPLTGRARLAMDRPDVRDNVGMRNTRLLASVLMRLGPLERPSDDIVRQLTFADREFLLWLVHLERADDDTTVVSSTCRCGASTDVDVHRDDLLVNVLDDGDAEIVDGRRHFTFTHERHGDLVVRMATGEDEERLAPMHGRSPEEAQMRGLHGSVVSLGGRRPTWDEFLDMPAKIMEWVASVLGSIDIGASQHVKVTCHACGEVATEILTPFDFSGTSSSGTEVRPPYETRYSGSDSKEA